MKKNQISLLAALLAAHVEYAVVGGVAVNAYGYQRATNDLDVFIRPIPFISKSDLIENKRQTGRLRDLADIEELTRLPDTDPSL